MYERKLVVPLLFMLATFNVTLNSFKHRYVLPISHFSFIQCTFKPRYYVAGQIQTDVLLQSAKSTANTEMTAKKLCRSLGG